ncbi:MAG TPA: class I SAM-dependent methyltransferase [Alphaproteobacteria bacterium]|nr:class I SAM-dependent methyltransferase [Alphaproteobacteria bacterium]
MPGEAAHHIGTAGTCRFCGAALSETMVDLGETPLANSYIAPDQAAGYEPRFPLHVYVCTTCFLAQLPAHETPDAIFGDYAYFSSYSQSWLDHAERYAEAMIERFDINPTNRVVEIASNDGYLLQFFKARGVPVLGIEPAANVAAAAQANDIPTLVQFFGTEAAQGLANARKTADLLVANNVLAHVPDLNDFVEGLRMALKWTGVLTIEFPHLLRLIEQNQFDTIYHEHFSYFSLTTAERVLKVHDLRIFDVEELPTHGGSLRIYACRDELDRETTSNVIRIKQDEAKAGLQRMDTYRDFGRRAAAVGRELRDFLTNVKSAGKSVAGYGAPAKGNTLLNYCGIGPELLPYTVDVSPHKQGRLLPGSHIPVEHPDVIAERKPDYLLVLPWNLTDEIISDMRHVRDWGGRFVVPIPDVKVLP